MKTKSLRILAALAATGLLFAAAPAHASDTESDSRAPIIVKPDPSDRIIPAPRPPRIPPCTVKPAPPGWQVPMYCEILPAPRPPRDIIIPGPGPVLPGPVIPIDR